MIMLSNPFISPAPVHCYPEGIEQGFPVLVFQKSHFGHLHRFAEEGMGQDLFMEERLKLCANILVIDHCFITCRPHLIGNHIQICMGLSTLRTTSFYTLSYVLDLETIVLVCSATCACPV